MIRITNTQLFMLIVAFEIGSTTLFAIGIGAGRDAWIAFFLGSLIGLCLFWVFTEIPKHYPNKNLSEIVTDVLGRKLAVVMLLLFALEFYSVGSMNFYEFGRLIKITTLPLSPLFFIWYLFIMVLIYILCLGFEVLGRTCEILLPYMVIFLIVIFIFTLFSGQFEIGALLPVLGNGMQPVLQELPNTIGFPFAEGVVFIVFWHLLDKPQLIRRTAFLAVGLSTLIILMSVISMIAVLGPELAAISEIPFLDVILMINIAEIITNLDSIAVFIMFIGGFYKTALHLYACSLIIHWLFRPIKLEWIMIVLGLTYPLFVHFRFPSLAHQKWYAEVTIYYLHLLFSLLTVLVVIIMLLKKKKKASS